VEEVVDEHDRPIGQRADRPRLGKLIDDEDDERDEQRPKAQIQPRVAASTVVVAYGSASSLASGISFPVTSHMPYVPFSMRSCA